MALAGKSTKVRSSDIAGGAGAYADVAGIKSASMNSNGQLLDTTTMAASYVAQILGLKSGAFSISGVWEPTDTNGQVRIRNAWLNDAELWIQFLPNGTDGFKAQVKVPTFTISSAVDGVVEMSAELPWTGAIAVAP